MSELNQVEVTRRVVVEEERDPVTRWLVWAAAFLALGVVSALVYAMVTGVFASGTAPRTFDEKSLAVSAEILRENPQSGAAYAQRAETLFRMGRVDEAYAVLDQGEQAVGDQLPALVYVLRTRTMLLNQEGRFAEAEEVGVRAMAASDDYLARQIEEMVAKGLNTAGADSSLSVNTAVQLADAYVGQEKWEEAIKLYSYALMYEPAASDILSLRGWAYLGMSAETSATLDFNEALRFMPDNESALAGLEELSGK